MKKIAVSLLVLSAIIIGGCTPKGKVSEQLVGNDEDTHGCIGSAGYSWCALKNKCLRVWEEPCSETTPSSTADETDSIKVAVKKALVIKHGESANDLNITVSKIMGSYSQGGASVPDQGGGMWFAAKVDNEWKLVWDGNGIISCIDLVAFPNFPNSMIPECFDQNSNKMVIR